MTQNDSLSDQIAEKIIKKVKNGQRSGSASASKRSASFELKEQDMKTYYVVHYSYETDQYKWGASIRYAVEDPNTQLDAAHKAITDKHGPNRPYTIMYTKKEEA